MMWLLMPTRLNSIISPGQSSAIGPLPTQPLREIKMSMVDQIKHIFIVLVLANTISA
jgi:hypothetical protein